MVPTIPTEISDIPRFFNGRPDGSSIEPSMIPAVGGDRPGGFFLILKCEGFEVLVYERGAPAWFSDLGAAKFLLVHGFVRDLITEEARVTMRGYF